AQGVPAEPRRRRGLRTGGTTDRVDVRDLEDLPGADEVVAQLVDGHEVAHAYPVALRDEAEGVTLYDGAQRVRLRRGETCEGPKGERGGDGTSELLQRSDGLLLGCQRTATLDANKR